MMEVDSILIKTEDVKQEGECCFCLNKEDLFSLLEPYNLKGNVEIYSTMIAECFQIELSSRVEECNRNLYVICACCIFRLRDAISLRSQVRIAYDRLQAKLFVKDDQDVVSNEYSDVIDMKEHIPEYDDSECDNVMECNVGASSSNAPAKIVLNEIDNDARLQHSTNNHDCKYCDKTFETDQHLSVHEKLHDVLKIYTHVADFSCEHCNVRFSSKNDLNKHIMSHVGDEGFVCVHCKMGFKNENDLQEHILSHMDVEEFICDYCRKGFSNDNDLKEHALLHADIERFICVHCKMGFEKRNDLKEHVMLHADNVDFLCVRCKLMFKNEFIWKRHLFLHDDIEEFICDYCRMRFMNRSDLKEHIVLHTVIEKFICNLCQKGFSNENDLKEHILLHTVIEKFICNLCQKRFSNENDLKEHILLHEVIKKFICDHCKKGFSNEIYFKKHILSHVDVEGLICGHCKMEFGNENDLKEHILLHKVIKKFICDLCQKGFSNENDFKEHILLHKVIKKFICEYCQKGFSSENYLKKHILSHMDVEELICGHCKMEFSNENNLKEHILLHTLIEKFTCNLCQKRFSNESDLKEHVLSHKVIKKFICEYCQMGFSNENYLKKHVLSHADVKGLICGHCKMGFSNENDLKEHILSHADNEGFICDYCRTSFTNRNDLKRHILLHKDEKYSFCDNCKKGFIEDLDCKEDFLSQSGIENTKRDLCELCNRRKLILWLVEKGLFKIPTCPVCDSDMRLYVRRKGYFYYQCNKQGAIPHKKSLSMSQNSWLSKTLMNWDRAMLITYMFAINDKKYENIIKKSSTGGKITSSSTVTDWMKRCQEVCIDWSLRHQSQRKLGGDGVVVEVYESKIGRYRLVGGPWIFAMVEISNGDNQLKCGEFRIEVSKEKGRDAETILSIVRRHVEVGTIICSDDWRIYYRLTDAGFEKNHRVLKNGKPIARPVKSHWTALKKTISSDIRRANKQIYIHEFLWRRHVAFNSLDPLDYFITCIKNVYDPNA